MRTHRTEFRVGGLLLALAGLLMVVAGRPSSAGAAPRVDPVKARVAEGYGRLPLHFEPNRGQAPAQVRFLSRGRYHSLFLTSTGFSVSVPRGAQRSRSGKPKTARERSPRIEMRLLGSSPRPRVAAAAPLPGKVNYLLGRDPKAWRTNIPTFGEIRYGSVYPGIDLVYHGNQRELEYDFVLAPGADPAAIRFGFSGAESSAIDPAGDLVLHTPAGDLRHHRPIAYQMIDGQRVLVPARFRIDQVFRSSGVQVLGDPSRSRGDLNTRGPQARIPEYLKAEGLNTTRIGFQLAAYDKTKPLTIDPTSTFRYSTYLGGDGGDLALDIAVDSSKDAYICGDTDSTDFPTQGAFQGSLNASFRDAFLTKLNVDGSSILFSTYFGGSDFDSAQAVAVDSSGQPAIAGFSASSDLPLQAPIQNALNGTLDSFVTKFSADGSSLVFSTYLGGSDTEDAAGITFSPIDELWLAGTTESTDFPVVNPRQNANAGRSDVFVTKLNTAGSAILNSSYLGGNADDLLGGLEVDPNGKVYLVGTTFSANFPTQSAVQSTLASVTTSDAFVTKLDASGAFVFSTALGGTSDEEGPGIAADAAGNAYVTGSTFSNDFPTLNAFQASRAGGADAFISKIAPAGGSLVYSTFFGGSADENDPGIYDVLAGDIAVDDNGRAYVTGSTGSGDFPNINAGQPATGGNLDAFLVQLEPNGMQSLLSTFLGGGGDDLGFGIAVDSNRDVYVTGLTTSADFPTTTGAFDTGANGEEGFVSKIRVGDHRSPEIVVHSPSAAPTNSPVHFRADIFDDSTVTWELKVDMNVIATGSNKGADAIDVTHPVADGTHAFQIVAMDVNGLTSTETLPLTVDSTPPVVNITSPANNACVRNPVSIMADIIDDTAVTWKVEIDNNQIGMGTNKGLNAINLSASPTEGLHPLRVKVTDEAGNITDITQEFTVDNINPVVQITTPANNATVTSPVRIKADITETNDVEWVLEIDGGQVAAGMTKGNDAVNEVRALAVGPHTIEVKAKDPCDNHGTATINITVEMPKPAPTNLKARALSDSQIKLTWEFPDHAGELGFFIERKDAFSLPFTRIGSADPGARSFTDSGLAPNSTFTYHVQASFMGGDGPFSNEDSATTQPVQPNRPPTIRFDPAPRNGSVYVGEIGGTLRVTITANDPDPGDSAHLHVTDLPPGAQDDPVGEGELVSTRRLTWTPRPGQEGIFEVHYIAEDSQGEMTRRTLAIQVVTLGFCARGSTGSPTSVKFDGSLGYKNGKLGGNMKVTDPKNKRTLVSRVIQSLTMTRNRATVEGEGTLNGKGKHRFHMVLEDGPNGGPGDRLVELTVDGVPWQVSPLVKGSDIHFHDSPKDK
jgi:hypothetical protein